jgi:hypothetical protein
MLTIPTSDLLGILGDALPFISPDKDDIERRCIDLRWDGTMLHAGATDVTRVVVSSWHPEDDPDHDTQLQFGVVLGEDRPTTWQILLSADDVGHLLKTAKPVKGLEQTLLTLVYADGPVLEVARAKQARLPGIQLAYDGLNFAFPDLRQALVEAASRAEAVKEIAWNGELMADFGRVRQRGGPARWTFSGPQHPAVVEIGTRFVGSIQPVPEGRRRSAGA